MCPIQIQLSSDLLSSSVNDKNGYKCFLSFHLDPCSGMIERQLKGWNLSISLPIEPGFDLL